jgi:SSS family solute:Na+ symporter
MLCVFFFARLWRRAGILTDAELIELRYDGKSAPKLRGFMAIYRGVLINCVVMGWVILAMAKICEVMLGWPKVTSIIVLLLIAFIYTAMSGFWGVVITDLVQFIMAMTGSVALAGVVLWHIGGASEMVKQVAATPGVSPKVFDIVPDLSTASQMAILTFIVSLSLQWWANGEGNGYLAQRLFAAKNERHSMLAALWFNFVHYVLRPWPWIIVGLASLYYFPPLMPQQDLVILPALLEDRAYLLYQLSLDPELAYPQMIVQFLPIGLRGLMVASLLAAFMSTMDTHLNWGASYLVNDLYKRFVRKDAAPTHYVNASRIFMAALMLLAGVVAWHSKSIEGAWIFIFVLSAGSGFVLLLRWYWWRINVWSEISAIIASLMFAIGNWLAKPLAALGLISSDMMFKIEYFYSSQMFAVRLIAIVLIVTPIWLIVTMLTRPVSQSHLESFYRRVYPGGWWKPIALLCPDITTEKVRYNWLSWLAGVVCLYSGLFGVGMFCLARYPEAIAWTALSLASGYWMMHRISRS